MKALTPIRASIAKPRHALAAFVAAVRSGRVQPGSYLIVESLYRLSREKIRLRVNQIRADETVKTHAKALGKLTGVDVGKLLPIPDVSNKKFPEIKAHEDRGRYTRLHHFSS